MKRDFDIIRNILFQIEKAPAGEPIQTLLWNPEIDEAVLGEHLQIMIERGLVEGEVRSVRPPIFTILRLTWAGHDFVNNARNDTVWNKAMAEIKQKGLAATIPVVTAVLTKLALAHAGLSHGP